MILLGNPTSTKRPTDESNSDGQGSGNYALASRQPQDKSITSASYHLVFMPVMTCDIETWSLIIDHVDELKFAQRAMEKAMCSLNNVWTNY